MRAMSLGRGLFTALILAICVFIIAPIAVVLVASVSTTPFLTFPPKGFTLRWFSEIVVLDMHVEAFRFSFVIAVFSTILSVAIAVVVALGMRRAEFPGKAALQSFFLSPIIIPELALALGLLQYFSQIGVIKGMVPLVLAHAVVCAPYAIRTIQAAATSINDDLHDCAMSLGARSTHVFRDITVPLIRPGLVAGAVMAFVVSFDNVTISLFLASPGSTPLPALLYNQAAESGLNTSLAAISALLVIFMLIIMALVERFIGLEKFLASSHHNGESRA